MSGENLPSLEDRVEIELREALHLQLDTVLDAENPGRLRVIDDLIEEAQRGKVISVSVHSLPKPADVPAGP